MKKMIMPGILLVFAIAMVSWGFVGHETVALIAEKHLTPQARQAVKALLGGQALADVASWADQVRNQPEWKSTTPEHFMNAPLGLSYADFEKEVKGRLQRKPTIILIFNALCG